MSPSKTIAYEIADDEESLSMPPSARATGAALPSSGANFEDDEFAPPPLSARPFCGRPLCMTLAVAIALIVAAVAATGLVVSRRKSSEGEGEGAETAIADASAGNATAGVGGDAQATPTGAGNGNANYTLAPIADGPVAEFAVEVVKSTPHDPGAFLQGLEYDAARGVFFESTGLYGQSTLRRVEPETGKVLQKFKVPDGRIFGEGITLHKSDHIYMLTWKAQKGFVFNQSSFDVIREWTYEGEGWGLASDRGNDEIYMTDGTSDVRVLEPETLKEKRRFSVTMDGSPVKKLNEAEWVCGELWANVWMTNYIVRIDPTTGKVRSRISVPNLPRKEDLVEGKSHDVLNGIAFDEATRRLWITGKLWPAVYQVTINDTTFAGQCGA